MPTYDYECIQCGHRFDLFQSITEAPLNSCPVCQGPVKRLISAGAGLIFKGSGFYITDYKNNGSVKSNNSVRKDEAKPGDKKDVAKDKGETKSPSASKEKN